MACYQSRLPLTLSVRNVGLEHLLKRTILVVGPKVSGLEFVLLRLRQTRVLDVRKDTLGHRHGIRALELTSAVVYGLILRTHVDVLTGHTGLVLTSQLGNPVVSLSGLNDALGSRFGVHPSLGQDALLCCNELLLLRSQRVITLEPSILLTQLLDHLPSGRRVILILGLSDSQLKLSSLLSVALVGLLTGFRFEVLIDLRTEDVLDLALATEDVQLLLAHGVQEVQAVFFMNRIVRQHGQRVDCLLVSWDLTRLQTLVQIAGKHLARRRVLHNGDVVHHRSDVVACFQCGLGR